MACALKTGRNKRLLDKYTNIVGNESAAYSILYYNNWNDLSKTPNGQDSVLYRKLLSRFDGDEVKASKYKSYCYSPAFFDMFGNWTTGDRSKLVEPGLVDENGEPLVVYHSTPKEFNEFKSPDNNYWFSPTKNDTKSYGNNTISAFLNVRKITKLIEKEIILDKKVNLNLHETYSFGYSYHMHSSYKLN